MMEQTTSQAPIARIFVDEALDCGARAGVDIPALLARLGLDAVPKDRLGPEQFAQIWLALSVKMEDEFFGLGARPMRPGSVTLMGHAVRGAENFDTALRRSLRFLRLALDEPYGVIRFEGDRCVVALVETTDTRSAFAYRTFFLILHGLNCWLVGDRIPLLAVDFPCSAPEGESDYDTFFGVPVRFDAPEARLEFSAATLARPVRRSEAQLKAFLRTSPASFLRGYRDVIGIKRQILDTCLAGPAATWPDADGVAQALGLSRTTLHRRLTEAGQSLRGLKDEERRRRAVRLLRQGDVPIAEVAAAAGYAEDSAFHRAFARWFDETPGEMRATFSAPKARER